MLSDLQLVYEDTINGSLDWLFFPWFDNDFIPKYRFSTCRFDDYEYILTVVIEDQNEAINNYPYSQQATLRVYNSEGAIIYDDYVWINSTTLFNISCGVVPKKVRLIYSSDVIAQLPQNSPAYIEKMVTENIDLIPGHDVTIIIIFCLLPIVYLKYKFSIKKKSKIISGN